MNRNEFRKIFKSIGPVVLPVIHVLNHDQTESNVQMIMREGARGVFLINHDHGPEQMLPIIRKIRRMYPSLWMGVNFLGVNGLGAFPMLAQLQNEDIVIDAYWADNSAVDENKSIDDQPGAKAITDARAEYEWQGMYFGGTAFKKQRVVSEEKHEYAAKVAARFMDVVTTSGVATGEAADTRKIAAFRRGAEDAPIALASGVTTGNVKDYARDVDCFMVATGINIPGDFYNIEPERLRRLMFITKEFGLSG
ncbi:MAG: adenine phosphoribosyltransferase [Gammaproteobacteria bacterium]|nr:adenine phosphoribosyltransferase [Gammaproteobacteria bacterium]